MIDGYYWVWFYNHERPRVMRCLDGKWIPFTDEFVHDEIDFTDRPPLWISEPVG